ncbi:G5 domain-containing protein [Aerococcaceae bacterium DSM 111020]|nr:G5 domain-containing protein [Aerococcaceae bacterium DSM 111020]
MTIGMFNQSQGTGDVDLETRANYFYGSHQTMGDLNPDANFGTREERREEKIPFRVRYQTTTDLPAGESQTIQQGAD